VGYPFFVFLVSSVFFLAVARQYVQRRRPHQLAWALSLAAAAAGSLSYVLFLAADKSELAFRLYYIFGALLTAPLLGLGSILIISRGEQAMARARWVVYAVSAACVAGTAALLINPINSTVLHRLNGGPGTNPDVYNAGPGVVFVVVLNIFGALAVVGVAIYSAWQLYKRHGSRRLVTANVIIALGTYVISQAGGMARTDHGVGLFWLTMAIGWVVLFAGFLLTFNLHRDVPVPARSAGAVVQT
jgi:hypothetical protein